MTAEVLLPLPRERVEVSIIRIDL
jgi:hypothetical protein